METLLQIHLLESGGIIQRFITWIIENGGLYFLLFVVFAETGLFVGFFLPGDSLLFAAGIFMGRLVNELAGQPAETQQPFGFYHIVIILMVIAASVIGNIVGYWFGNKAGPLLFQRKDTWVFKKKHLVRAKDFYDHYGIRPQSILRAVFVNVTSGHYAQGGSTITQQVVKNALLTPDKNIVRKLKEWVLAVKLDAQVDKDSILTIYLNESPYGGSIYGVEEASIAYFGKHAKDVNLVEAAYLAGMPQAPSYFPQKWISQLDQHLIRALWEILIMMAKLTW